MIFDNLFKRKVDIVNDNGEIETYYVNRRETITKETLRELSNNRGDDEDVKQPISKLQVNISV